MRYAPEPWGTELEAAITGIARPGPPARSGPSPPAGSMPPPAAGSSRPATWTRGTPAVPFPAAALADFDITADGKILVTILLRP